MTDPFWKTTPMTDMTPTQWESLCDGCGLCCLLRLEDEDTGDIALTNVACAYLDHGTCTCKDYSNRFANVPDCTKVTVDNVDDFNWLPDTCAYRLVAAGEDLPDWHHLVCGNKQAVHDAGISLQHIMNSEEDVDDLYTHPEPYIIEIRPAKPD